MTAMRTLPRCAVVTLCSANRLHHLQNQLAALGRYPDVDTVVVWLDREEPPLLDAHEVMHVPPGQNGMQLAAARNLGAQRAMQRGCGLLVFLDADCVPGPDLVTLYRSAITQYPDAILCGPVTYLEPEAAPIDLDSLEQWTNPHSARPAPPDGTVAVANPDEYRLFWSLSFAMSAEAWHRSGGFFDGYEGYGAEDTDFAFTARRAGTPLMWVGGAHAYHQHHPTHSPPRQHLDDILRNGALFARRWGEWPMVGWLEQFERDGLVTQVNGAWTRRPPSADASNSRVESERQRR